MFGYAWMMIAFPLIGAAINGFFGKKINNKKISGWLGTAMLAGSFATALAIAGALVLLYEFFWWVVAAVIIALAGYILWDNVRELTRSRRSDAE